VELTEVEGHQIMAGGELSMCRPSRQRRTAAWGCSSCLETVLHQGGTLRLLTRRTEGLTHRAAQLAWRHGPDFEHGVARSQAPVEDGWPLVGDEQRLSDSTRRRATWRELGSIRKEEKGAQTLPRCWPSRG
jgi:hypothetical protein